MIILPATSSDYITLISVWQSATATNHHFVSADDMAFYHSMLPTYFASVTLYKAVEANGCILGDEPMRVAEEIAKSDTIHHINLPVIGRVTMASSTKCFVWGQMP